MTPELEPSSPLSYYVYFRIRADTDQHEARDRIIAMQAAIAAQTGAIGSLMARRDDSTTWMEIYAPVLDARAFEVALQQAVGSADIDALIEPGSARHLERFVDIGAGS